jgi:hypothetical protein
VSILGANNAAIATKSFAVNIIAQGGSIEAVRRSLHYSNIKK